VFIGYLSSGEGWHNNHHAAPRSARHGHQWWEFDFTWVAIRTLASLGLARRIVLPPAGLQAGAGTVPMTTRHDRDIPQG
jgi:stearoyl-CoA desaturase (delta-9 desaturase)